MDHACMIPSGLHETDVAAVMLLLPDCSIVREPCTTSARCRARPPIERMKKHNALRRMLVPAAAGLPEALQSRRSERKI